MENQLELQSLQPEIEKIQDSIKSFNLYDEEYFKNSPTYVGYYLHGSILYGMQFMYTKKPNWLRRTLVKLILGWTWVGKL